MFIAAIVVSFALGIYENGIQCSTIRYRVGHDTTDVKNFTYSTSNLTYKKNLENRVSKMGTDVFPIKKSEKNVNGILILDKKKERLESAKLNNRRPKFIGSLGFLAGLGSERLANFTPSGATNILTKLLNGVVSPYFTPPGYFFAFYNPQQFVPYPYPYPVVQYPPPTPTPSLLNYNNLQNSVNEIPIAPSPSLNLPLTEFPTILEKISNLTNGEVPSQNNATATRMDADGNEQPAETGSSNNEVQTNREPAATELDSKRILPSNANNDADWNTDSLVIGEETGFRLFGFGETPTTTRTTTTTPTTPTTPIPTTPTTPTTPIPTTPTPTTTPVPNVTASTLPAENTTESKIPFNGYYGGFPQDVGRVILTTEEPQQRYLKDYAEDIFSVPFERPAVFNPYPNVESYPSPFVNSFSAAERFPEFLNTVESDRYVYDTENPRNFNGFRPILK